MSDILIRGMEMPRSCIECALFCNCDACEGYECYCGLLGAVGYVESISEDSRRKDCPLVELPPHGDLISKQTALAALHSDYAYAAMDIIENEVPVVVPAERSDANG